MPSVQYYEDLSDEALLEAAKYERCTPELMKAVANRLDDLIEAVAKNEFREWDYESKLDGLAGMLSASQQTVDDLLETVRELREEIDTLKGKN